MVKIFYPNKKVLFIDLYLSGKMVHKMMFMVVKTYQTKTFDFIFNGARGIKRTIIRLV